MNNRLIKIIFGTCISFYMFVVCFNNIFDYDSNFQFVRMVSSMGDVISNEKTGWRSIYNETLHHLMYLFIIVLELTIAILTMIGVFKMLKKRKSSSVAFNQSKKLLLTGIALGVVLWFGMFITIGGEWFLMWQSKIWNGQSNAFSLCICFLLFSIHLNQRDA